MRFLHGERGQAMVEFVFIIQFVLMLVLAAAEMGMALSHNLSLNAASREGARAAGNFANGGGALGCGGGQSPNAAIVDPQTIAATQRIMTGNGALVSIADVTEIRIFKATATGGETAGEINIWTYTPGIGPIVDGENLDFSPSATQGWPACERNNISPADSVGVTIVYTYRARTPFGWLIPGLKTIAMTDRTVMPLNATR